MPELTQPLKYQEAIAQAKGFVLLSWEQEKVIGLTKALGDLTTATEVSVFIGPEGGITKDEADYAARRGVLTVSLGKRILRAETAGIAVLAAVMYELGEMG